MIRAAAAHATSARLVREFFTFHIQRRLQRELAAIIPPEEIPLRSSLVASQLFGLALARYILTLDPLAKVPAETVIAAVAPTIDRYLRGTLGPAVKQYLRGDSPPQSSGG